MRLTLRTLLAYLDDILEQEDHEDIGTKVRDSEVATTLVHRTRDVMRRLRLGAPQVIGTGMGRDPNSVAEYLDNTLAAEQVQLFERVCLESDVHLAEVGSCHHILAMILGEPAQVDPASRERMYRLIEVAAERAEAESRPAAAAAVAAASTSLPGQTRDSTAAAPAAREELASPARRKLEVPEYLRTSSGGRLRPALLTLLGASLATAVLLFLFDHRPLYRLLGWEEPSHVASTSGGNEPQQLPQDQRKPSSLVANKAIPPAGGPAPLAQNSTAPDSRTKTGKPPGPSLVTPVPNATTVRPAEATSPVKNTDLVPPSYPAAKLAPNGATVVPPGAARGTKTAPPTAPRDATPMDATAVKPDVTFRPKGGDGSGKTSDQVASVDRATIPPGPGATPGSGAVKPVEPPAERLAIGRLLSQEQVLLHSDAKSEPWERVPHGGPLYTGERLLVLPAFRPMISLAGVTMELEGATELELGRPDAAGNPQLSVSYGRLIMRPLGQPNARLRVRFGELEGVLSFGDAESTLALEVRPYRAVPGTDPEQVPSARRVDLYAASGRIGWTVGGLTETLRGPRRWTLSDKRPAAEAKTTALPGWIVAAEVTPLEQRGARSIEQALSPSRSAKLTLVEQAAQQRVEVRSLATRCCSYIGNFEPLVKGLSDEDQHAGWPTYVADLRSAVARDRQTAAEVRATFEKLRREKAPELYRMLWGYTPAGLAGGDARQLVAYLDSDDLDFRVLSFWNLQEITGLGLNYRPEYSEAKRSQSILRWKKRLDERRIAPPEPMAPAAAAKGA